MSNRRERALQDICDATPTPSQTEIAPILKGKFRMQGPADGPNCDSLTHMVASENNKVFSSCSDRSQKLDYKGKSGTCNVCSAPCSSFFHANEFLLESNEESAGETCAGNIETGQSSVLSSVGGMDSTCDSFSENATAKASLKTSNPSASDDNVVHAKSEGGRRSPEGHDDCLSCVSGTDEHANRKSDAEDSGIKYKKLSTSGDVSGRVSPSSSQTGILSDNSGMVRHSSTKSNDDLSDLPKVQTASQASNGKYLSHDQNLRDVKDDKPFNTKDELLKGSTEHLNSSSPGGVASDVVFGNPPATTLDPMVNNEDMEVEIHPADETDDSEMVEQDVKVCDICGDAGREDLLAFCCRCSDGAEHTYCMKEMLGKVPEGDWLCEECKAVEEVDKERDEKIGRVDKNEKNNSSGQASENVNSSDVEGRSTKGFMKNLSKRLRDDEDAEVSSIAKKPALESIVGSPKTSSSCRTAALSCERSFKSSDRGKIQFPRHSSPDTILVNDSMESAKLASDLQVHNSRGTFLKSNSFNSLNSKSKVKLVDQVVIQRQKSAKEPSSFRLKDGAVRSICKSISFKSSNSSRFESKTKMLSPRLCHGQDIKNPKERSAFDRQQSLRAEQPLNNSAMSASLSSTSRIDKTPASWVESSSLVTISNHHELKPVQSDGKAVALSRSSSLAARRTADSSSSTGEFKRPSMHCRSTLGVTSACGFNANEGLPDGLPRPKDSTDSVDRLRDYSGNRLGPPSIKSSIDESNNLKAAIEAAVLRKPGVYRKHRASVQSDESSMPTVGCEVASHKDNISGARTKTISSDAELPERPSDTSRNMLPNVPAVMPLSLKFLAIPDHEYIWQGSFEIYRNGQNFDSLYGIQAHLSTCASPKVIEAVNKFKSKIMLNEVPRLSTWPIQFQENGVREDNIALFFFAKDLESHVKIYKVLLDNMMKNDLALKGNINGVELLIFPSSLLPDNLQRWNLLFYLWGLFRVKKESFLQQMPEAVNQYCVPRDIPQPIMSLPENRCSPKPITENACKDVHPILEVSASEELRECGTEGSSLDQLDHGLGSSSSHAVHCDDTKQCQEMRVASQEGGIGSSCTPPVSRSSSSSGREQMQMQLDTPIDRRQSPQDFSKPIAETPMEGIGEGTTSDKTCHQNKVEKRIDAREDLSSNGESPLEGSRNKLDLNVEDCSWLFSQDESTHSESSLVPLTVYADNSHVSPANDDIFNERAVENQMNHALETLVPESYENAERQFFPVESRPVAGIPLHDGPIRWKLHSLEDRLDLNDRALDVELALGAERTPVALGIEPLPISKVDQKINEERILDETGPKAEEEVSASLSLSLSFPFPDMELNSEPGANTQQLVAKRKLVNTSSMHFLLGNLRDV